MEVNFWKKFQILSGSSLKIIAIITMLIDHIGAALIEQLLIRGFFTDVKSYGFYFDLDMKLRMIGRIAFPIFCFLLVEGFLHTKNKKNYSLRLFLFALFSEIPFDLAFRNQLFAWDYQNVFFTLLVGFLVMWAWERYHGKLYLQIPLLIFGGYAASYVLHSDYGYKGIALIFILYLFHKNRFLFSLVGALSLLWEAPAIFAFIPINLYNGKRGLSMKYFFYFFYPLHLLCLYGIRLYFF